jgi:hypothetical protein
MAAYFAYRSFDLGPTGKYLKRFEDDTVLDWFRHHWPRLAIEDREESDRRLAEVLGCEGWFLLNPFHWSVAAAIPRPASGEALLELLQRHLEADGIVGDPHALQVFTEEDGEGGALFYFDDHFLKQSPGVAAYLLHDDWRLPAGHGDAPFVPCVETIELRPGGSGTGATYVVLLERESKYPLDDLDGGYRIEGVRLPELARHLCRLPPDTSGGRWPGRLRQLPALMLAGVESAGPAEGTFLRAVQTDPDEAVHWAAWSDWRQERDQEPPGIHLLRGAFQRMARFPGRFQDALPEDAHVATSCRRLIDMESQRRSELRSTHHSLSLVSDHLAQMCLDGSWTDEPYYGQWIFFDDTWAGAHPDLANAILRFAGRWDVLSVD